MKTELDNKLIHSALHTKFLGLTIDGTLPCGIHIDHPITKVKTACCFIK